MVRLLWLIVSVPVSFIVPLTSNTIIRPDFETASLKEPVPDAFRLVTWYTETLDAPLAPREYFPPPSAPGKAGKFDALYAEPNGIIIINTDRNTVIIQITFFI